MNNVSLVARLCVMRITCMVMLAHFFKVCGKFVKFESHVLFWNFFYVDRIPSVK